MTLSSARMIPGVVFSLNRLWITPITGMVIIWIGLKSYDDELENYEGRGIEVNKSNKRKILIA
jgi:hypothetical protein